MQENVSCQLVLGCRRLSGFQLWCLTKLLPKPIGSKASALLLHAVHPGKACREILCCCLSVQRKWPLLLHPRWSFFWQQLGLPSLPILRRSSRHLAVKGQQQKLFKQFPFTLPHLFLFQTLHTREKARALELNLTSPHSVSHAYKFCFLLFLWSLSQSASPAALLLECIDSSDL